METLAALFDEDVVWHIPGNNPLAGDIHGRDALWRWFERLREVTDGTFRLEDHDVLATDDHVVALNVMSVLRDGVRISVNMANVMHFPRRATAGKMVPPVRPLGVGSATRRSYVSRCACAQVTGISPA